MKAFIALNLLAVLGVSLAKPAYERENGLLNATDGRIARARREPKSTLKRIVRQALMDHNDPFSQFMIDAQSDFIESCKSNGYNTYELQRAFDDMNECVSRKQIFRTEKYEFLCNMDRCASESVRQAEHCLPDNEKYFPQFLLDSAISQISFLYDDYDIILNDNVMPCLRNWVRTHFDMDSYLESVSDRCTIAANQQDTDELPPSREAFCQWLRPASQCFADLLGENCNNNNEYLKKFRNDLVAAVLKPCEGLCV